MPLARHGARHRFASVSRAEVVIDLIKRLTGYQRVIIWVTTKSDGQFRRLLDINGVEQEFGVRASAELRIGIAVLCSAATLQSSGSWSAGVATGL